MYINETGATKEQVPVEVPKSLQIADITFGKQEIKDTARLMKLHKIFK